MKKSLIGLAVLAAFFAKGANAEDMYRGAWYVVPGFDYIHTDNDLKADNGRSLFLSLGKELSEHWDIQGRLGYNKVDENTSLPTAGGQYKNTTLGLDALYMFSREKFRPFLLAGLGAARNNVDYRDAGVSDKSNTSWLASVGLGAQYLFSDTFGIQADVRQQWSRSSAKSAVAGIDDGTIGNTLVSFGGIFRFGAPAPVVPEPLPEPAPLPEIKAVEPVPVPALVETAPAPAPVCTPSTETITVGAEKLFGFDKANLKEEGRKALDDAAAKIKANPEIKAVIVTGHTDRIGSDAYNMKLSQRRAKQVADYLVAQGVERQLISAEGKGESEPVVQCAGNKVNKKLIACLQPNRRVEIRAEATKQVGCN